MSDFPRYHILVSRLPVAVDLWTWAQWWENNLKARRIGDDRVGEKCRVSTVFLGLDHNFWGGDPLLFETMIFGGPMNGEMWRYSTYSEAERGHAWSLAAAKAATEQIKSIADKAGADK